MTPNLSTFLLLQFLPDIHSKRLLELLFKSIFHIIVCKDDDVRVPFGKAHDHAREIVEEHQALDKLGEAIKGQL